MTLSTNKPIRIAHEDIECFKGMGMTLGIQLRTPFQNKVVKNRLYKVRQIQRHIRNGQVRDGVHSYKNKESIDGNKRFMFKCIIPKGSLYYEGEHDCGCVGYCSDKILFLELIAVYGAHLSLVRRMIEKIEKMGITVSVPMKGGENMP